LIARPDVFCDPDLPDNEEREQQLQRERQMELLRREPQMLEPEILTMFRRAALL
jgi:hypothetical protein